MAAENAMKLSLLLYAQNDAYEQIELEELIGDLTKRDDHMPVGPICSLVPECYHKHCSNDVLKSFLASSQQSAKELEKRINPADIPVIVREYRETVGDHMPVGPICSLVPERYHKHCSQDVLKSFLASSQQIAKELEKRIYPADIPVIVREYRETVGLLILKYELGTNVPHRVSCTILRNFLKSFTSSLSSMPSSM